MQAAERGYVLSQITKNLLNLLDLYGVYALTAAIAHALEKNAPHPNVVRLYLEKQRKKNNLPPPLAINLPDDRRVRNLSVRVHDLKSYDQLTSITEITETSGDKGNVK